MMTKDTLFTSVPIVLCKVVSGENNPTTKIPCKYFCFEQDFHLCACYGCLGAYPNVHYSLDVTDANLRKYTRTTEKK